MLEDVDDAAVVFHVLETQGHALAVFEPFLGRLVATNEEVPGRFWNTVEVLLYIDIDATSMPAVAVHLHRAYRREDDARL